MILMCFMIAIVYADLKESSDTDKAQTYTQKLKEASENINAKVSDNDTLDFDYPE